MRGCVARGCGKRGRGRPDDDLWFRDGHEFLHHKTHSAVATARDGADVGHVVDGHVSRCRTTGIPSRCRTRQSRHASGRPNPNGRRCRVDRRRVHDPDCSFAGIGGLEHGRGSSTYSVTTTQTVHVVGWCRAAHHDDGQPAGHHLESDRRRRARGHHRTVPAGCTHSQSAGDRHSCTDVRLHADHNIRDRDTRRPDL